MFLSEKEKYLNTIFITLSMAIVVFVTLILVFQSLFFAFMIPITTNPIFISGFVTLIYIVFSFRNTHYSILQSIFISFLFITLFLSALVVSSLIYDVSWDGRDYHQRAVIQLVNGWNPFYEVLYPEDIYFNVWLNHYPKATWILGASFYKLTGNIEAGKATNILLIIAVFFSSAGFFLQNQKNILFSILLAFLVSLNPVSVTQMFTFYVDGAVASTVSLLIISFLLMIKNETPATWIRYLFLMCIIIISMNIKFTGTFYIAIMSSFIIIILSLFYRKYLANYIKFLALGVILGVLLVGFNPYITNTFLYGNPIYPTLSSSKYNISYVMSNQMPANFRSLSSAEKLLISIFSKSQNTYGYDSGPIKFPFHVDYNEILAFSVPDTRVGGWGPLFGASLIISLLTGLYTLKNLGRIKTIVLLLIFGIFISSLLNPESWWARYAPHLWLVPLLIIGCHGVYRLPKGKILFFISIFILSVNVILVLGANICSNVTKTQLIHLSLDNIKRTNQKIYVYYGVFEPTQILLQKNHIEFEVVNDYESLGEAIELSPGVYYSYNKN